MKHVNCQQSCRVAYSILSQVVLYTTAVHAPAFLRHVPLDPPLSPRQEKLIVCTFAPPAFVLPRSDPVQSVAVMETLFRRSDS